MITYWDTQRTDWQARALDKKIDEIFLLGYAGQGGAPLLLTSRFGAKSQVFRTLVKEDETEILEIRPDSDWARIFQFRIENEAGSRFSLQGGMEVYFQIKERPR